MRELNEKIVEKFWIGVQKTDACWNWIGFFDKSGLPVIRSNELRDDGKNHLIEVSPRRVSLQIAQRTISDDDRVLPLICNNKICVNPEHLVHGDEARFWAKVQKLSGADDCWVWTAAFDKDMYGKFRLSENGKKIDIRAHVYSWLLFTGLSHSKGLQVCHKCDHPYCVNPDHLFLGTVQDNMEDRDAKGRQTKGDKHPKSKITKEQVIEMRELFATGKYTKTQLSHLYKLSLSNTSAIIRRDIWKSVP